MEELKRRVAKMDTIIWVLAELEAPEGDSDTTTESASSSSDDAPTESDGSDDTDEYDSD